MAFQLRWLPFLLIPLGLASGQLSAQTLGSEARDVAWEEFEANYDGPLQPSYSRATGRLTQILGRVAISDGPIGEPQLEQYARRVLHQARALTGVDQDQLVETYRNVTGGLLIWQAEQRIGGLPVVGTRFEAVLQRDGFLLALRSGGDLAPREFQAHFPVTANEAAELARISVSGATEHTRAWNPTRVIVGGDTPRSAWRVNVANPARHSDQWMLYVDGASGETFRMDRTALEADIDGDVFGRGIPSLSHDAGGPPIPLILENLHVLGYAPASATVMPTSGNGCNEARPAVSGNGLKIAYTQRCGGTRQIWIMNADGSAQTQLTSGSAEHHSVTVNGVGDVLAFVSNATGNNEIWTIHSDGTGLAQVTANGANNLEPRLNELGTRLSFSSDVDGDSEVFLVDVSGAALLQLTSNTDYDGQADFAGNGSKLAFVSNRDGDNEIFTIDADGSGETQVTFNGVADSSPSMDTLGENLVFTSLMATSFDPGGGLPTGPGAAALGSAGAQRARTTLWAVHADGSGLDQVVGGPGYSSEPQLTGAGTALLYTYRPRINRPRSIRLLDLVTGSELNITDGTQDSFHPGVSDAGLVSTWQVKEPGELSIGVALNTPATFDATVTDGLGDYTLDMPAGVSTQISARLTGLYARVIDLAPQVPSLRARATAVAPATGAALLFNPSGSEERRTTQVTAYWHTDEAHRSAAAILGAPSFGLTLPLPIDIALRARVNDPSAVHNAYYSPATMEMTFFQGLGPMAPNTAYDTVIYHEYGHFMDDAFGGIGTTDPCAGAFAFSEGLGDVMAISTSGSVVVGEDFDGPGTAIRDYGKSVALGGSSTRQLDCLDCITDAGFPEVHQHGEAFAGFYVDLAGLLGPGVADDIVFGAFSTNPPDMNSAVLAMFLRDADPALGFGGSGDPVFAPHYDELCEAAAKHGFDCWPRPDLGSEVCLINPCGVAPGLHKTTTTEWMGMTAGPPQALCDMPPGAADEDGVTLGMVWASGGTESVSVTISVDPALLGSGRYGGSVLAGGPNELRLVYLNAWVFVEDGVGGFSAVEHVLGTGSTSSDTGPAGFAPNTLAFNPDLFGGASAAFSFDIKVPVVTEDRFAHVRFRLDYGEDCGVLGTLNCAMDPALSGPCGPARYGEVEDHQVLIVVP